MQRVRRERAAQKVPFILFRVPVRLPRHETVEQPMEFRRKRQNFDGATPPLAQAPADREKRFHFDPLLQFPLDLRDQLGTPGG